MKTRSLHSIVLLWSTAAEHTSVLAEPGTASHTAGPSPTSCSFSCADILLAKRRLFITATLGQSLGCAASHLFAQQTTFPPGSFCSSVGAATSAVLVAPCTRTQVALQMQSAHLQKEASDSANTTHRLMKVSGEMTASLKQQCELLLFRIKWVILFPPTHTPLLAINCHFASRGCWQMLQMLFSLFLLFQRGEKK